VIEDHAGVIMLRRIRAIFENGVFRPTLAVSLPEGTIVEVIVSEEVSTKKLLAALDEIARMPQEGPSDGYSGADHDQILYGGDINER
jgi:predicted DNA-binding antitoxin AbrB/MazE fold protein